MWQVPKTVLRATFASPRFTWMLSLPMWRVMWIG
jgi:hypothetical protein